MQNASKRSTQSRLHQQAAQLRARGGGVDAAHLDDLAFAGLAGDDDDVTFRDAESGGKKPRKLCVRRPIDGRRG